MHYDLDSSSDHNKFQLAREVFCSIRTKWNHIIYYATSFQSSDLQSIIVEKLRRSVPDVSEVGRMSTPACRLPCDIVRGFRFSAASAVKRQPPFDYSTNRRIDHTSIRLFDDSIIPPFDYSTIRRFNDSTRPPFNYSTSRPCNYSTIRRIDHTLTKPPFDYSTIQPYHHFTIRPIDHSTVQIFEDSII